LEAFSLFRFVHIAAGFLALFLFWIPLVTKKGGQVHNRTGWVYVMAMSLVSISAFYMGMYRVLFDDSADATRVSFSWFLIFISILSGASCWYGIRVLRFKKRKERHRSLVDLFVSGLLLGSGVAIGLYGFTIGTPLITYFPILGIFLGGSQLYYWLQKPVKKMHWLFEHLSGMIACSISTVTAFTVFGAPRLLNIPSTSLFLWLLPTMVLVPILIGFTIKYEKKYNRKSKTING
jgi:uncharacterized membrane protein